MDRRWRWVRRREKEKIGESEKERDEEEVYRILVEIGNNDVASGGMG